MMAGAQCAKASQGLDIRRGLFLYLYTQKPYTIMHFRVTKCAIYRNMLYIQKNMNPEEELGILEECRNGNLTRFSALYDLYAEKIYRFIYLKTHHKETAEDIMSVVFIKTLENISSYDMKKAKFSTWLYRIAGNTVIDHYRAARPSANIEDAWDISDGIDIARDADMKLRLATVQKHMQKLAPKQRDIIMMRIWQDMSYEEIAEIMGSSTDAARMLFSRAMRELKKEMPLGALITLLTLGVTLF
jgi:RNA polymerase sigma factor (sigma-70 family)